MDARHPKDGRYYRIPLLDEFSLQSAEAQRRGRQDLVQQQDLTDGCGSGQASREEQLKRPRKVVKGIEVKTSNERRFGSLSEAQRFACVTRYQMQQAIEKGEVLQGFRWYFEGQHHEEWSCVKCVETYGDYRDDEERKYIECNKCGEMWHWECHVPPVVQKPRGDWFCSKCASEYTGGQAGAGMRVEG